MLGGHQCFQQCPSPLNLFPDPLEQRSDTDWHSRLSHFLSSTITTRHEHRFMDLVWTEPRSFAFCLTLHLTVLLCRTLKFQHSISRTAMVNLCSNVDIVSGLTITCKCLLAHDGSMLSVICATKYSSLVDLMQLWRIRQRWSCPQAASQSYFTSNLPARIDPVRSGSAHVDDA